MKITMASFLLTMFVIQSIVACNNPKNIILSRDDSLQLYNIVKREDNRVGRKRLCEHADKHFASLGDAGFEQMNKDLHTCLREFYQAEVVLSHMLDYSLKCGNKSSTASWDPDRKQLIVKTQIACLGLPIIGEISTFSYSRWGVPTHNRWKKITGKEHIVCYVNFDEHNSIVTTGGEGSSGSIFILS